MKRLLKGEGATAVTRIEDGPAKGLWKGALHNRALPDEMDGHVIEVFWEYCCI